MNGELAFPVSEYTAIFGGPVWKTPPNVVAGSGQGRTAEAATGFKKEITLAGPPIHTPFTQGRGAKRNWLGKGINHGPEPCRHATRTSGTRCAARPKQFLKLQSNFRMADDPPGKHGRLARCSAKRDCSGMHFARGSVTL